MKSVIKSTYNDKSDKIDAVKAHHSFHTSPSSISRVPSHWKSDVDFNASNDFCVNAYKRFREAEFKEKNKEYYKKYEHDDVPVKDDNSLNDHSFSEGDNFRITEDKDSITNSDLDKLEMKILRKMSQELQTDGESASSLESNIKLFKTTVQQIFDNFYQNMQDFELYKKKFNDILAKIKDDSVEEMEDFIKDMFRNICSSNSEDSNATKTIDENDRSEKHSTRNRDLNVSEEAIKHCGSAAVQSYKNESFLTDSTANYSTSKSHIEMENESFRVYLLSNNPYVEIKMNNRSLLSEINIKNHGTDDIQSQLASAEDIKKLAEKRLQLEQHAHYDDKMSQKQKECHENDKEIPVKISHAKKNIYLDEDFTLDTERNENKFFIFKICTYICKKLRRN